MDSVLITGASGDIGQAVAARFAKEGCKLYLLGHTRVDALRSYAIRLSETYEIMTEVFAIDFALGTKPIKEVMDKIGRIDVVIHNAGNANYAPLTHIGRDDWQHLMDVNVTSAYEIIRHTIPKMIAQGTGGHILNVSSVWGSRGASGEAGYAASKGALDALTKSMAKELAPHGISVNALSLGVIDTGMNRDHLNNAELLVLQNEIPRGRFGTAEEVAEMLYLLSKAPDYLTGAVIPFSGGWEL